MFQHDRKAALGAARRLDVVATAVITVLIMAGAIGIGAAVVIGRQVGGNHGTLIMVLGCIGSVLGVVFGVLIPFTAQAIARYIEARVNG